MAKRKQINSSEKNNKKGKENRGQGDYETYTPGILIQEVASIGLSTRIKGVKIGRIHQLLSTFELNYLFLLDWFAEILDIKEQYPLDLKETVALAKEVNISHPPRSNPDNPQTITTDFLITIQQPIGTKEIARTLKYSKDLINKRVLEKFEIERLYWQERNIDWGIVTELDINETLIQNIKWLYKYRIINSLPELIVGKLMSEMADFMLPQIRKNQQPLRTITKLCDEKFSLVSGHSLALVRHLIANKHWLVDMLIPIQPEKPLAFISNNEGGERNDIG